MFMYYICGLYINKYKQRSTSRWMYYVLLLRLMFTYRPLTEHLNVRVENLQTSKELGS